MDKNREGGSSDLPPAPGPDAWSKAEAAEWESDETIPARRDDDG